MKVLSSLIIIDKDNIKIIYECDNKKNTECEAHNDCKYCDYTTKAKYAKDIKEERTRKGRFKREERRDRTTQRNNKKNDEWRRYFPFQNTKLYKKNIYFKPNKVK